MVAVRLLILTPWYYPFVHPRAHRWTYLAAHWAARGHEVHVVCARRRGWAQEEQHNGVWVHRVGFDSLKEVFFYQTCSTAARGRIGAGRLAPGLALRVLSALYRYGWKNLCFPDDAWLWYRPACRRAMALLAERPFDAVISVSLPFTGHLVGHYLKRRHPAVRWLADVGDPYSAYPGPVTNPLYRWVGRRLERSVLAQADAVAVTNAAAAERYRRHFGLDEARIAVIPPLYRDFSAEEPQEPAWVDDRWHIGYFGAFYAPIRTPYALAALIRQTFSRRPELIDRLVIHLYGEVFPEFWHRLSALPNTVLHGLHPPAQAQSHMRRMRVLISVGNITSWQLPSKAVSYLAAGRPVVHLSYLDEDAFVRFWGDCPNLLVLRVHRDRVTEPDVERWLHYLYHPPPPLAEQEIARRLAPFYTPAIASAYLDRLTARKPPE